MSTATPFDDELRIGAIYITKVGDGKVRLWNDDRCEVVEIGEDDLEAVLQMVMDTR